MTPVRLRRPALSLAATVAALALLAVPAAAPAAKPGSLTQLSGKRGCLVDRSKPARSCARARALDGPGPFMGSRAIVVSPDGRHVYVASSGSDAIAIFSRDRKTGRLSQGLSKFGCVSAKGLGGCGIAVGLDEPNSVAVSPDGRSVYATSRAGNSLTSFLRSPKSGALHQLPPERGGCISMLPIPGCVSARALVTPDVVLVSPDGKNVYAGTFFGNSVASFARDATTGALAQLAGTAGCIAEASEGCATGIALKGVEGLAISGDGTSVYAAAALSNAVVELNRDPATGALAQAGDGSGCLVETALSGCTLGRELAGANAVAVSPDDDNVYVTSLFSNSVTAFDRSVTDGALAQKEATNACLTYLRSTGCSFGRALVAPEGVAVSPDGRNVYLASYESGAIDVLDRRAEGGAVRQKPGAQGCLAIKGRGCARARALKGVSSIALSPDGRHLYSTAYESDAVGVFRRNR